MRIGGQMMQIMEEKVLLHWISANLLYFCGVLNMNMLSPLCFNLIRSISSDRRSRGFYALLNAVSVPVKLKFYL